MRADTPSPGERATRMRTIIATLAAVLVIAVLGYLGFIYSGVYDIAATDPHWGITRWAMETVRTRSIKAHAAGVRVPPGLDNPAKLAMGVEHFAMHCAVCHGAPGVPKGDIAAGLYPQPADLAVAATLYSDGELFWILKHGIKMTGMPAWSDHSDDELWATVAFLKKLKSGLSEREYGELVKANMMRGMKHQPGGGAAPPPSAPDHGNMPGMIPPTPPANQGGAPAPAPPHGH
jgi:mono/diheme cytochrome c family protein